MPEHHAASLAGAVALWSAMMLVMMAPAVTPWARTLARLAGGGGGTGTPWALGGFLSGYYVVWLGYSFIGAAAQVGIGHVGPRAAGTILLGAGIYQFTPLKQACLRHCRSPLTFFLSAWSDRPPRVLRLGLHHGLWCLGCCWALMAVMLAAGAAHAGWMVVLAVTTAAEQVLPRPALVRRGVGAALIAAAVIALMFRVP